MPALQDGADHRQHALGPVADERLEPAEPLGDPGTWDDVLPLLTSRDAVALDRPRTGNLSRELAWLAPRVEGAWIVGASGGATLGPGRGGSGRAICRRDLHEPAVGSLAPTLLMAAAHAFATGGTAAFGAALYGPSWTPETAGGRPTR